MLFGDSLDRAREAVPPFLVGGPFPSVYLEHPLSGEPFLDVTVLLKNLEPETRVESPAAGAHGAMLDWYAETCSDDDSVTCGFEIDTSKPALPEAAVHFQPRTRTELVRPFCEAVGEPERAELYLDLGKRMPDDWPLSFFGMFRGRAGSPLRVCGYLSDAGKSACARDPEHLAAVFDTVGFSAYEKTMLSQASALMAAAPGTVDFQFDIFPDGKLGPTFAIDVQFEIEQPEAVRATFEAGAGANVMGLLESWDAADGRWKQAAASAFARAIPIELDDGSPGRFAFTLMPQWVKARWTNGDLQPAKLYHLASAGLLDG
ncbi:MAG: hypothetical protein IJ087_21515 [Eggerthellaceae bacterium]|nr:hypothetical protein [Eggerthellaceae bacterium]